MNTGKIVREHRISKGLTQSDLAKKLGVSASNVSLIETGKTKFGYRFLYKFCMRMKIPMWKLVRNASEKHEAFFGVKKGPKSNPTVIKRLQRVG